MVGAEAYSSDTASGRGYSLDLSDALTYLRINNSASSDRNYTNTFDSASFTYSLWLKSTDGGWTRWSEIGGKGNEEASEGWALRAREYEAGDFRNGTRVDFYKTTADTAMNGDSFIDLTDQSWHQLTFTYDAGTSNLNLYVDGVMEGNATAASMNSATTRALVFGAREDGSRGENILIDTIQFYNQALNEAEVVQLYNTTFTPALHSEVSFSNQVARLQIAGTVGKDYRVETTDDLRSTEDWQVVTNITPLTASPFDILNFTTNNAGFYRVIFLP